MSTSLNAIPFIERLYLPLRTSGDDRTRAEVILTCPANVTDVVLTFRLVVPDPLVSRTGWAPTAGMTDVSPNGPVLQEVVERLKNRSLTRFRRYVNQVFEQFLIRRGMCYTMFATWLMGQGRALADQSLPAGPRT